MIKRSLYQCFNARFPIKGDRIYCDKGHSLLRISRKDGTISVVRLARGEPLELTVCQLCRDFDELGPPVPREERGWTSISAAGV